MSDLDRLLDNDRQILREQTAEAIAAGLKRRVAARIPMRAPWWRVPAVALASLCIGMIVSPRVRLYDVPAPVVQVVRPAAAAPIESKIDEAPHKPQLVRTTFAHARLRKKPLAPAKPFDVPGPAQEEKRVLMELAQANPQEQSLVAQQQQQMRQDYERQRSQFEERLKIQQGDQSDHR